ncbi:unnamed protein product [Mucor circinelloides]|uniref:Peptidase S28 n=1 Tax=Mucor circinelloides f. circinelloides (strain 1006PhL) TaxID=1220926 RepID=S2JK19_MUCC1|nr:hypothetical protein HMPREF1544_10420 [Mucor circinelloides 1006PhL]
MKYFTSFIVLLSICHLAVAFYTPGSTIRNKIRSKQVGGISKQSIDKDKLPEKYGPFYFDQPIDHFSSNQTTFKHRYWANTDAYKPGGPVILYNAGETPADGRSYYVVNSTMAELAKNLNGIVIVMEHRFYGKSMPSPTFSADYLSTLNTKQALEDIASFITDLKLPNLDVELPPAPETKYIVYGGSYSGSLSAWMRLKYPELVFAAVPSSAPVQMSYNYYQYYDPIRKYAPKHCIQALRSVILYVDHILFSPIGQKAALKKKFGAEDLEHDDDFAELLSYPLGLWQEMSPAKNPFVDDFCSIFDGTTSLQEHVEAYGNYTKNIIKQACDEDETVNECLDTHDPRSKMYTDDTDENRAWFWQVCTEYAYWQTGAPIWKPTIVSRKLDTTWFQRQCPLMFGEHNVPKRPIWREINQEYEGWHLSLDRVFWIDGEWDPWRTLSVQSDDAPNRIDWEEDAKYAVLPEAVHHWDFFVSDTVSEAIKNTQDDVYKAMKKWIDEADREKYEHRSNKDKYIVQYQSP